MGLTAQEHAKVEAVFKKLDADGSGHLDAHEVRRGLVAMGFPETSTTDDAVAKMMSAVDDDGDGSVTTAEFKALWEMNREHTSQAGFGASMISSLFSFEASNLFGGSGGKRVRKTGSPVQILFDTVDEDGSGTIDAEEFVALMIVAGIGDGSFQCDERGARQVMQQLGVDKNGDGLLDEAEFTGLMENLARVTEMLVSDLCTLLIEALVTE